MLTRDQIGLRLDRAAAQAEAEQYKAALRTVVNLLSEVLPDLVMLASGRTYDDAGRRYGDHKHSHECLQWSAENPHGPWEGYCAETHVFVQGAPEDYR